MNHINSKHLTILALILAPAASNAALSTQREQELKEAKLLIEEMQSAGILKVDEKTGKIILTKDLMEVLKMSGKASSANFTEIAAACTHGDTFVTCIQDTK